MQDLCIDSNLPCNYISLFPGIHNRFRACVQAVWRTVNQPAFETYILRKIVEEILPKKSSTTTNVKNSNWMPGPPRSYVDYVRDNICFLEKRTMVDRTSNLLPVVENSLKILRYIITLADGVRDCHVKSLKMYTMLILVKRGTVSYVLYVTPFKKLKVHDSVHTVYIYTYIYIILSFDMHVQIINNCQINITN